jgi:hypothetical protein
MAVIKHSADKTMCASMSVSKALLVSKDPGVDVSAETVQCSCFSNWWQCYGHVMFFVPQTKQCCRVLVLPVRLFNKLDTTEPNNNNKNSNNNNNNNNNKKQTTNYTEVNLPD